MEKLSEEQLKALAVSQLDQCRAIARDVMGEMTIDDLARTLVILTSPRDFGRTFTLMTYAPAGMRELFRF